MERLNIQLLADGVEMPATSGGAAAPATADAQVQGQSAQVPAEQVQQGETFEALTGKGGKYEREYNAALQKAVRSRLRGAEAQKQRMDKMLPILSWVGSMYDVDMSDMDKVDLDALNEKIAQDNRWYEKESMETGIPVDTVRRMRNAERENARLRQESAQMHAEEEQRQRFAALQESFAAVQQRYPQAELSAEIGNRAFMSLITAGFDPMQAYEAAHYRELQQAAMQYGVQRTVAQVQANGMRPQEGALGSPAGQETKIDPRNLTPQQREDIRRRVARGEKITF